MTRRPTPATGPIVVLLVVALVPAAVLAALWRWADDQATGADEVPPTTSTIVAPAPPDPPLLTPALSLRRLARPISLDINLAQFENDLAPLTASVNDRSCVTVSIEGNVVGTTNGSSAVIPASTQKVVVAATALELLGRDHVFTTRVVAPATTDGVVAGDLFLVGGGDPLLSADWYPTSNLERLAVFNHTSLDDLADRVVAAGVTRIDGGVVGDGSRYDDEWFAPGWGSGVAGVEAGPYDALLANDARVMGAELRADDPVTAAAAEFSRLLEARGVVVGEAAASGVAPADGREIASIDSAPLTDVIAEMLTNSDNNTAELLVKEMGVATVGQGTREAGLAAASATLASWGLDVADVVLDDGSGLSLGNRLTCDVLVGVLARFGTDAAIAQGLPVAGRTGTLADIFVGTAVEGRLLGKTGTLNNPPFNEDPPAVKALAGYLPIDGGGSIEYALVLNGPTISDQSEYRPVWDTLAATLGSYPAGPGPDVLGPR